MHRINVFFKDEKDHSEIFDVVAGVRIIFLVMGLLSSTIDLGLSFSVNAIGESAVEIAYKLLIVTITNIALLIFYIQTVRKHNYKSNFLIYIVEVMTCAYGLLGIYAFIRYSFELQIATLAALVGLIGLIDLILVNMAIGSYFLQNNIKNGLIEFTILMNIISIGLLLVL